MYYFVNIKTGQLLKSTDKPSGKDWREINEMMYDLFLLVAMEYCRQQVQNNLMD